MAMKIADIKEKLALARAATMAAFQNRDIDEVIRRKEEMHALRQVLQLLENPKPAGEAEHAERPRGRRPEKRSATEEKMRADMQQGMRLESLTEKQIADQYKVSRDTGRKARDSVLAPVKK
jgi:hypothetical protein